MKENKAKIRAFLLQYIQKHDLQDEVDIFASGFVNSLFAMQLVLFLESEFAINIERDDLKLDNFRSVNALDDLVKRKSVSAVQA
jgi:acyl carrier protein